MTQIYFVNFFHFSIAKKTHPPFHPDQVIIAPRIVLSPKITETLHLFLKQHSLKTAEQLVSLVLSLINKWPTNGLQQSIGCCYFMLKIAKYGAKKEPCTF